MWRVRGLIGRMPALALPTVFLRGGVAMEHLCIPICVAGNWFALLERAVGSWLAKQTNSTAETALLPLGLFSPGLGPTLAMSLLVGAMLLW